MTLRRGLMSDTGGVPKSGSNQAELVENDGEATPLTGFAGVMISSAARGI